MKTETIQITPELLMLLSEVDEFKGAWRALDTLALERLNLLRRVATIERIGSSLASKAASSPLGTPQPQAVRCSCCRFGSSQAARPITGR